VPAQAARRAGAKMPREEAIAGGTSALIKLRFRSGSATSVRATRGRRPLLLSKGLPGILLSEGKTQSIAIGDRDRADWQPIGVGTVMPIRSICKQDCRTLRAVRAPNRSREDGPFDEWTDQMPASAASIFWTRCSRAGAKGWDIPISSSDELELIGAPATLWA
jgi:hypothetical protein